jgi:hypothetical protein
MSKRRLGAHAPHRVFAEQITKKLIRVNKAVRSRRTWSKFGDCDGQEVGANLLVHAQGCWRVAPKDARSLVFAVGRHLAVEGGFRRGC